MTHLAVSTYREGSIAGFIVEFLRATRNIHTAKEISSILKLDLSTTQKRLTDLQKGKNPDVIVHCVVKGKTRGENVYRAA